MQTHDDNSHEVSRQLFERNPSKPQFIKDLRGRAEEMMEKLGSTITAGALGEFPLMEWTAPNGVAVRQFSPDPQDILRISVGGLIQVGQYCVFRGDRAKCAHILRMALAAIEKEPRRTE